MTREEIDTMKYKVCCSMCDNKKCVKGTESCNAERWAKNKLESEIDMKDIELVVKIPKDVYEDIIVHDGENREGAKSAYYFERLIQNGAPLPKGHGRLIDADNIAFSQFFDAGDYSQAMRGIHESQTIIEADESGDKE